MNGWGESNQFGQSVYHRGGSSSYERFQGQKRLVSKKGGEAEFICLSLTNVVTSMKRTQSL